MSMRRKYRDYGRTDKSDEIWFELNELFKKIKDNPERYTPEFFCLDVESGYFEFLELFDEMNIME